MDAATIYAIYESNGHINHDGIRPERGYFLDEAAAERYVLEQNHAALVDAVELHNKASLDASQRPLGPKHVELFAPTLEEFSAPDYRQRLVPPSRLIDCYVEAIEPNTGTGAGTD